MAADLKTLIETVAKALADYPDAVSVRESERRGGTVYELQVAATDLGRVIGRQGRTAAALRTASRVASERSTRGPARRSIWSLRWLRCWVMSSSCATARARSGEVTRLRVVLAITPTSSIRRWMSSWSTWLRRFCIAVETVGISG